MRAKEHTPTLDPSAIFTFGFIIESIKGFGGASIWLCNKDDIFFIYDAILIIVTQ
jgi:hypothetical protein